MDGEESVRASLVGVVVLLIVATYLTVTSKTKDEVTQECEMP